VATGIRDTARSQAGAIVPSTQGPEGVGLLVSTLDGWLAAMQSQIAATREQRMASAKRIRQHSAELAAVARSV
jgi:hypothetical protein